MSNAPSAYGSASASPPPRPARRRPRSARRAADVEQLGGQVGGDDLGAGRGGRDGGVAGAGRHVEHPVARPTPAASTRIGPEVGDDLGGDGGVVAQRPHGAVLGLQGPVGLGRGRPVECGSRELVMTGRLGTCRSGRSSTRSVPGASAAAYRVRPWARPTTSSARREGDGAARRALDPAGGPRAAARQPALQRPAPRAAADVADPAVQAAAAARRGPAWSTRSEDGAASRYVLTPAGRELAGGRGARRLGGPLDRRARRGRTSTRSCCCGTCTATSTGRSVPPGRTVVSFRFPDLPAKRRSWWLVLTPEAVDVCDFDPGHRGRRRRDRPAARPGRGLARRPRLAAGAALGDGRGARPAGGPPADPGLVPAVAVRRRAPRRARRDLLSQDACAGFRRVWSGHEGGRSERGQESRVPGRDHPVRGARVHPART